MHVYLLTYNYNKSTTLIDVFSTYESAKNRLVEIVTAYYNTLINNKVDVVLALSKTEYYSSFYLIEEKEVLS